MRKYRYQSYADIERMNAHFGAQVFAEYRLLVGSFLQDLPINQWIDYRVYMDAASAEPFVISACLYMLKENRRKEYWEFNEDYSQIRRIKALPPIKPLYQSYETKQDHCSVMPG